MTFPCHPHWMRWTPYEASIIGARPVGRGYVRRKVGPLGIRTLDCLG